MQILREWRAAISSIQDGHRAVPVGYSGEEMQVQTTIANEVTSSW
ncbi:hypothetical protein [Chelativorans sp.]|nr:hypothetical protein [Chelativorans sp.]